MTETKKPRGRPKGSTNKKFSLTSFADKPNILPLPKTETGQLKELKNLLINSAGSRVVHKAVEIALNDEHPAQLAAIKLCMDRMLPVTMFEKEGKQRSAVNITISGIGGVKIGSHKTIEADDIDDVNGTTTALNSSTIQVDDKNIELASVAAVTGRTGTASTSSATITGSVS